MVVAEAGVEEIIDIVDITVAGQVPTPITKPNLEYNGPTPKKDIEDDRNGWSSVWFRTLEYPEGISVQRMVGGKKFTHAHHVELLYTLEELCTATVTRAMVRGVKKVVGQRFKLTNGD